MTDKAGVEADGWVFYDAECPLCLRWMERTKRALPRKSFRFVPLQSPFAKTQLGLKASGPLTEMRLLFPDGRSLGGGDAAIEIARQIWWMWPLWALSRIPFVMLLVRALYRFVAKNRYCSTSSCVAKRRITWLDWIPLLVMPFATLPLRSFLPAWVFMWVFVTALFFGCKWLTWRRAQIPMSTAGSIRTFGYLFAWPGMDAKTFLSRKTVAKPKVAEWFLAAGRFLSGVIFVWWAAKETVTINPIANAWLCMFGLTLILHFGLFHLVALAWQTAGIAAEPLMKSPATATSLADFWGARWNTAFNKLVADLAFRPLQRRGGIAFATMTVFAISGVIHELALSLPARGGYGLPFAYFLLQGAGVLLQRSAIGRALGLGYELRGWLFMFAFTAGPAYWLFHPIFVRNVILPMLQVVGAN